MSDIYFLIINAKHNYSGKNSFILSPSYISRRPGRSRDYWLLPPSTNNKRNDSNNYKNIITKLIDSIFGNKRIIKRGTFLDMEYIKDYMWNNKIIDLNDKTINPANYPSIKTLNDQSITNIKRIQKRAEKLDARLLMVNITFYLEKVHSTTTDKLKNRCNYHKTMLKAHLNLEQRGEYIYNDKTNKVEYVQEPFINAILRNMFGNEQHGGLRKKGTNSKSRKKRTMHSRKYSRKYSKIMTNKNNNKTKKYKK